MTDEDATFREHFLEDHDIFIDQIRILADLGRELCKEIAAKEASLQRLYSLLQTRKELANR